MTRTSTRGLGWTAIAAAALAGAALAQSGGDAHSKSAHSKSAHSDSAHSKSAHSDSAHSTSAHSQSAHGSQPAAGHGGQGGFLRAGDAGNYATSSPDAARHQFWQTLASRHVKGSRVSYAGFQRDEDQLDAYLAVLAATDPSTLSKDEQLAFWINAYNAFTVKLILRRYPKIKSIKDFWGPWDKRDWDVNGKKRTLNEIEHKILRKEFDEPRIHFAINCASVGCPDLRDEAYVAARIDEQLADATRKFLANPSKGLRVADEPGRIWGRNKNVYLSKIFSWFGEDFETGPGGKLGFVQPWAPPEVQAFMKKHKGKLSVKYLDYDWSLNGD